MQKRLPETKRQERGRLIKELNKEFDSKDPVYPRGSAQSKKHHRFLINRTLEELQLLKLAGDKIAKNETA